LDGQTNLEATASGPLADYVAVAEDVAQQLLAAGAADILS
jgi:hypothetical protein